MAKRTQQHSLAQARARVRVKAGEGFMYVAAIGAKMVKIGFSLDPPRRVKDFELYYRGTHEVRLLGQFPCSFEAERAFHAQHLRLQIRRGTDRVPGREHYPRSLFTTPAEQAAA